MNVPLSDIALWEALRNGSREALGSIYKRHISGLIQYGYRVTSDSQLIRDSIHDLFLYLWLHKDSVSSTDSIKFYLFRSLRNRIQQNKLTNKLQFSDMDNANQFEALFAELPVEETIIEAEWELENTIRLRHAISRLSSRQQEVIQLRYFHSFRLEEIAQMMDITNQSVRNLLHRTILQLRAAFELTGKLLLILWGT